MTNTSKTLLFFGNERLVSGLKSTDTPILRSLIEAGYTVKAVVSHHSDGSSRTNRPLEIAALAEAHSIPVFLPNKPADIKEELIALGADVGILVAYGRLISQDIIDIFPGGIINIHPSLLPKYRGPTPIESTIVNGDSQTGVSIMQLSAGMDEGPIYAQRSVELNGTETKFDLYDTLATTSKELLLDVLPSILDGGLKPTVQDSSQATYSALLTKEDGLLRPDTLSAIDAERKVRAYLGFPKSKLTVLGHDIIITKSHVSSEVETKTPLDVLCRDGAYLSIDELIAPSGRIMNAAAFLNGYSAGA
jgi:methionyl-tRNA formyltransferase